MKKLLVGVIAFLLLGCATNSSIQPLRAVDNGFGAKFSEEINLYLSGKKTYQDLSFEAQKVYLHRQSEIEILKILEGSPKISGNQMMVFLKMHTPSEVVTAIKSDQQLSQVEKDKLILEITRVKPSVPKDIDIVQLPDQNKGKQIAGKLSWVQESRQWIKQVVLYNDAPMPDINHPVWSYTASLVPPERVGSRTWEPYAYRLFN